MGGGVQINPQTGLPVSTGTTQGGGMGGMQGGGTTSIPKPGGGTQGVTGGIDPLTGLPIGIGGPKPQPATRPSVGPVAMPVSVSNTGSGKKFGPIIRMVSMNGFRGFSVNSRPQPRPSVSSTKGLSLNSGSTGARAASTIKLRSARPTNLRGVTAGARGSAGRMFIRMGRTPGR